MEATEASEGASQTRSLAVYAKKELLRAEPEYKKHEGLLKIKAGIMHGRGEKLARKIA